MSSAARRESPLWSRRGEKIEFAELSLREQPFRALFNLRGDPDDPQFSLAVNEATGLSLPSANQFKTGGKRALAWLGPDEFLLIDDDPGAAGMQKGFRDRFSGVTCALTDVSSGATTLVVSGSGARDLLAQGWALDLHPRAFGPGHCAQSYLAKAPALLLHRDPAPVFDLVVRRSFADYVWTWLASCAKGNVMVLS